MKNGQYQVKSIHITLENGEVIEVPGCDPTATPFYRVSDNTIRQPDKPMKDWPKLKEHEIRWTT